MTTDDTTTTVGPGGFAVTPAGSLHTLRVTSERASFLVVSSGHRASAFFADLDAHVPDAPTDESLPPVIDVAGRHGLTSPSFP